MAHASAAEKAKQQAKKRRKQNKQKVTERPVSDESKYLILKHDASVSQLPAHKLKELERLEKEREERKTAEREERVHGTEHEFSDKIEALITRRIKYSEMISAADTETDAKKAKRMKRRGTRMLKKVTEKISAMEQQLAAWKDGEAERQASSTSRSKSQA